MKPAYEVVINGSYTRIDSFVTTEYQKAYDKMHEWLDDSWFRGNSVTLYEWNDGVRIELESDVNYT